MDRASAYWLAFLVFVGKVLSADFYLSSSGNDLNDGSSPVSAWKTITNINNHSFSGGDRIFFKGGETFEGSVYFNPDDQGISFNPIVVTSFGNGRATIYSDTNIAFAATNTAGIVVSNINFLGAGPTNGDSDGISFITDRPGNVKFPTVVIQKVDVSGFGACGIAVGGWNGGSGFRDVWIIEASSHDNGHSGIKIYARSPGGNTNIYIGRCKTYNNIGDSKLSGSGIVMSGVDHGTVEWCVSYNNGQFSRLQGPVGIWVYDSSNVTLQFNESHHNRSITGYDGGGFDFDVNTSHSIMQYNYSHDNDGPGFLQCCGSETTGNIIRYNISENDSKVDWAGAITTYGNVTDSQIYNNTLFFSQTNGRPAGALLLFSPTTNVRLRNNILMTTNGAPLAWIESGQENLLLQNNDYWSANGQFSITDANIDYTNFFSWRSASGREQINGAPSGFNVDPKLVGAGTGQTFNDSALLPTLSGYRLQQNSCLIDAGVDFPGMDHGAQDFYGDPIPTGAGWDIGAFEMAASGIFQLQSPTWKSNGLSFRAVALVGTTNDLEFSTNLVNWTPMLRWVSTNGALDFTNTPTSDATRRFYRLRRVN